MSKGFHGIYPMLYAFFRAENSLDRFAPRRQVGACIAAGAHGLAVGGLATECNKLSTDEKRQLVEWTIEDAADRVPVSVTVSENTLAGQRSAIDHAHEAGVAWVTEDVATNPVAMFFSSAHSNIVLTFKVSLSTPIAPL